MNPWLIAIGTTAVLGFLLTHMHAQSIVSQQGPNSGTLQYEDEPFKQATLRTPQQTAYSSQPNVADASSPNSTSQSNPPLMNVAVSSSQPSSGDYSTSGEKSASYSSAAQPSVSNVSSVDANVVSSKG